MVSKSEPPITNFNGMDAQPKLRSIVYIVELNEICPVDPGFLNDFHAQIVKNRIALGLKKPRLD